MLYVSQTPAYNIVQSPLASEEEEGSSGISHPGKSGKKGRSQNVTTADNQSEGKGYSLFNGWILIDPELVKLLGLDKVQI